MSFYEHACGTVGVSAQSSTADQIYLSSEIIYFTNWRWTCAPYRTCNSFVLWLMFSCWLNVGTMSSAVKGRSIFPSLSLCCALVENDMFCCKFLLNALVSLGCDLLNTGTITQGLTRENKEGVSFTRWREGSLPVIFFLLRLKCKTRSSTESILCKCKCHPVVF